jgi:hypothetical protein
MAADALIIICRSYDVLERRKRLMLLSGIKYTSSIGVYPHRQAWTRLRRVAK